MRCFTENFQVAEIFPSMNPPEKKKPKMEKSEGQKSYEGFVEASISSSEEFKQKATAINSAGLTAFKPADRKMTPLSRNLSGIVLKDGRYGLHLG